MCDEAKAELENFKEFLKMEYGKKRMVYNVEKL